MNKFIVMEKNNEASINNFCNEFGSLNIYDHLDKRLNLDPNDNYELFAGLIKYAREKHLPKIKVKYNKKKHSFSKWMTNEILQSINQKNRLYKTLVHTDTDNTDLFNRRKDEYKQYRAYLRKQIREAKRKYYDHIFFYTKMI